MWSNLCLVLAMHFLSTHKMGWTKDEVVRYREALVNVQTLMHSGNLRYKNPVEHGVANSIRKWLDQEIQAADLLINLGFVMSIAVEK